MLYAPKTASRQSFLEYFTSKSMAFLRTRLAFMCVRNAGDLFFHKLSSLEKALEIWQESEKLKIHSCNGH